MNRPESFNRLLQSIIKHTVVDWELVVSDASDVTMTSDNPNVVILPERPRLGCTKGYNNAFRAARGTWVIWLNDDAEVLPGYDEAAIAFMKDHPEIGLGALHYSEDNGPFHVNSSWGVTYANFGILRTRVGADVGFFDEDIEMYGCDNSLTFRILLAGLGVADIPAAKLIHHSEKDHQRVANQKSRIKDNLVLQKKYMHSRDKWTQTFNRLRVKNGTIAWSHGTPPAPMVIR